MKNIDLCAHIPEQFKPEFANMHNTISELTEEINRLRRKLFGPSSEARRVPAIIDPRGTLFDEAEAIVAADTSEQKVSQVAESEQSGEKKPEDKGKSKPTISGGGRKAFPDDIERIVTICDIPESEKTCPFDGAGLQEIGREIVEKINVIPSKIVINQYVYIKYACTECDNTIVQAETIPCALPKASCDVGMLVYVAMQKYLFGVPLYRMEQMFRESAFEVSRVSMARWMIQCADFLGDIAFEIKNYILSQNALHADETTLQVLKEPGKKAEAKSYMWLLCSAAHSHPAVFFQYETSRESKCASSLLQNFSGLVHVDGYAGYNSIIEKNNATRIACWAHVRRKFDVAEKDGAKDGKSIAGEFLTLIRKLFEIENEILEQKLEKILEIRKQKSKPVIDKIREKLDSAKLKIPPKCKLSLALKYLENEWEHLLQILCHANASISNNRIENHVRPFAIGRKNWLFADTQNGATSSAILYTILSSARANGISVELYLRKLLTELPIIYATQKTRVNLEPFLPWNCKDSCSLSKS
jgi:transposase